MNQKNQIGTLVLLLALIGSAAFFNMRINPLRGEVQLMREIHADEKAAAEERVRRGQQAEADYERLEARIEQDEARYRAILDTLPIRRDAGALVDAIQEAADRTGATLTGIAPSETEQPLSQDVVYITTNVTATGTYDTVRAFLTEIETLPRSARLNHLTLDRGRDDWRDPTITLDATVETYLYRSEGELQ